MPSKYDKPRETSGSGICARILDANQSRIIVIEPSNSVSIAEFLPAALKNATIIPLRKAITMKTYFGLK